MGLVPGRLPGSVQRPHGFVRFCFVFYRESSETVSLPHKSAQPWRLQSQHLGKSTGSLSVFEISDEDFSDSHFFGTEM